LKFKYYLRGIGLGILVATLVLTVSVRIRGGIMTDDRAIERAKELGMVIPEEETESGNISEQENETESGVRQEAETGNESGTEE
jgi:hypothetical protein